MDTTRLTDDACERLLAGTLTPADCDLYPLRWFLEDVRSTLVETVPRAARAMHPSAVTRQPSAPKLNPGAAVRRCKPERSWWSGGPFLG